MPLPTSNSSEFRIGNSGKFTDKGPFMSAEQCQGSRRNDRLKSQKDFFGALVIFTVADFKFWRICLVNISVGMVTFLYRKVREPPESEMWVWTHICPLKGPSHPLHCNRQTLPLLSKRCSGPDTHLGALEKWTWS